MDLEEGGLLILTAEVRLMQVYAWTPTESASPFRRARVANDWSTHPFPPNQHLHFSPLRRVQELQDSDGVAARVTRAGKVVILDPWDGSLTEIQAGAPYQVSGMLEAAIYTG